MSNRPAISCLALAGLLSLTQLASADVAPVLARDPFRAPPAPVETPRDRDENESNEAFEPILRSTIVRGKTSLVNLGGTILAVGEETHGYRLIAVSPFDATFKKDGERVKLEIFRAGKQTP